MSWKHLKVIVKDNIYLKIFVNIANMCINLGYWLLYFKMSMSIIISKPNKASYDSPKIFQPIILLNIFKKLFKKAIRKRLQFQAISNDFFHFNQLGELKQWSTTDASILLTQFKQDGLKIFKQACQHLISFNFSHH